MAHITCAIVAIVCFDLCQMRMFRQQTLANYAVEVIGTVAVSGCNIEQLVLFR